MGFDLSQLGGVVGPFTGSVSHLWPRPPTFSTPIGYEDNIGFRWSPQHLTPHGRLPKVRSCLGDHFGLRLLSDPSLAPFRQHPGRFPFLRGGGVSSGTLAFAYLFPFPMAGLAPASRLTCRSHATSLVTSRSTAPKHRCRYPGLLAPRSMARSEGFSVQTDLFSRQAR